MAGAGRTYFDTLSNEMLEHIAGFNNRSGKITVKLNKEGRAIFSVDNIEIGSLGLASVKHGSLHRSNAYNTASSDQKIAIFIDNLNFPIGEHDVRYITLPTTGVVIHHEKGPKQTSPEQIRFVSFNTVFIIIADKYGKEQVTKLLIDYLKLKQSTPPSNIWKRYSDTPIESFSISGWLEIRDALISKN